MRTRRASTARAERGAVRTPRARGAHRRAPARSPGPHQSDARPTRAAPPPPARGPATARAAARAESYPRRCSSLGSAPAAH
eukprot:6429667-Prymnesium_polylepis.1